MPGVHGNRSGGDGSRDPTVFGVTSASDAAGAATADCPGPHRRRGWPTARLMVRICALAGAILAAAALAAAALPVSHGTAGETNSATATTAAQHGSSVPAAEASPAEAVAEASPAHIDASTASLAAAAAAAAVSSEGSDLSAAAAPTAALASAPASTFAPTSVLGPQPLSSRRPGPDPAERIGPASGSDLVEKVGPASAASGPEEVLWVLVPHPDDEFAAWSLLENAPGLHKVFVLMTRGEQAAFCDEPHWDEGTGEARPLPWPAGRWSPECEEARISSFLGFMTQMGQSDSGMPDSYEFLGTVGPFDASGTPVCRHDRRRPAQMHDSPSAAGTDENGAVLSPDDPDGCVADSTALAWTSPQTTIIWFNLGDGDLTDEEVVWAARTALDNRETFRIDPSLPDRGIIGAAYFNGDGHHECDDYAHPDHGAVHDALRGTRFGAGRQATAVCAADPDATLAASVTRGSFLHVFATVGDVRLGAHPTHYGWLSSDPHGYHSSDYHGQSAALHRHQHFWADQ